MYLCRRSHCARSYCKYRQLLNSTVSAIAVTVAVVAATMARQPYTYSRRAAFLALELKLVMDVAG